MFGDLEKMCSAILEKTCSAITFGEIVFGANVGENVFGVFFGEKCVGNLEKSFSDFGENGSAITLEIWRNVVDAVMAILYWSSL